MVDVVPELRTDVLETALAVGRFDESCKSLEAAGYTIIPTTYLVAARLQQPIISLFLNAAGYVSEGVVYFPKGKPRLVRRSPILDDPQRAVEAHLEGKEFYPSSESIEKALKDSV